MDRLPSYQQFTSSIKKYASGIIREVINDNIIVDNFTYSEYFYKDMESTGAKINDDMQWVLRFTQTNIEAVDDILEAHFGESKVLTKYQKNARNALVKHYGNKMVFKKTDNGMFIIYPEGAEIVDLKRFGLEEIKKKNNRHYIILKN